MFLSCRCAATTCLPARTNMLALMLAAAHNFCAAGDAANGCACQGPSHTHAVSFAQPASRGSADHHRSDGLCNCAPPARAPGHRIERHRSAACGVRCALHLHPGLRSEVDNTHHLDWAALLVDASFVFLRLCTSARVRGRVRLRDRQHRCAPDVLSAAAPFCTSQMAFCAARMSLQCHCKASQARHRAPWHRHALHAYLIRKLTPCIQGRRSRGMRASFKCALSCPGTWHMHKRHSSRPLSWTRNPLAQAACVSVLWSRVEPAEGVLPTKLPCQMPTHFSIAALRRRLGAQLHACCSL